MKVYAFVPARSGSKGLPDKNIRNVGGHPLMAYSIAFGRALPIDRVIVSTDSEKYANIALRYGATCPYLRGAEASSDTAMEEDILADFAVNLLRYGIEMPDIWVRLKPTNPFRSIDSVVSGLAQMGSDDPPDSIRIVNRCDARICTIDDDGYLKPLLTSHWDPGRSVMRRTEFPDVYSPFNLDIFFHKNWEKWGPAYMGQKIHPIIEHSIIGIDINDADDLDIVKAMIETKPRPEIVASHIIDPA